MDLRSNEALSSQPARRIADNFLDLNLALRAGSIWGLTRAPTGPSRRPETLRSVFTVVAILAKTPVQG